MSVRPWKEMSEFERLLDNFGRLHEAAGEAGEAQAWGTVKKRLSDAGAVERRLITMWNEAQVSANAEAGRCVGCGEYDCGGACIH